MGTEKHDDPVELKWAADGAAVLARVAQGGCHLDSDGWWVETETGKLVGIDPATDQPMSDYELEKAMEEAERRKGGRPRSELPKRMVTMRLDADLLERLRAEGRGWQTRVNEMLRTATGLTEVKTRDSAVTKSAGREAKITDKKFKTGSASRTTAQGHETRHERSSAKSATVKRSRK